MAPSWLNPFDVLISLALIGGVVYGFVRGFVRMVLSLLVLYVCTVLAMAFYPWLGARVSYLSNGQMPQTVNEAVAFLLILVPSAAIINFALSRAFRDTQLPGIRQVDQLGGLVIGFVLVAVWIGLVLLAIAFVFNTPGFGSDSFRGNVLAYLQSSRLVPIFGNVLPIAFATLKPWMPRGQLPDLFSLKLF